MFRILFSAIVLLLFTPAPAPAAESIPGSSCTGITANSFRVAGGPENGGVSNLMFCNGGTHLWTGVINFQSTGNVGIGTTTPAGILDVEGGTSGSGNGTSINIVAQNGKASGNTNGGNITIQSGNNYGSGTGGNILINSQGSGGIGLNTYAGGPGGGYNTVAIGYQAQTAADFAVAIGSYAAANGISSLAMGNDVTTDGNYSLAVGLGTAAGANPQVTGTGSLGIFMGDQSGVIVSANNVMAIMGGKVGIGTVTPAAPLHVNGEEILSMKALACSGTTAGGIRYNSTSGGSVQFCNGTSWATVGAGGPIGSTTQIAYNNAGTEAGSANLTFSGTVLTVTGDISYSGVLIDTSDRRAKDNIQPLPSGQLGKLMQLEPVSFVMKNDPRHRTELGLIAQDTERLYPELVQTDVNGMKSMAYVGLVSPLIKAVQEQQAEIAKLWAGLAFVFCAALLPTFLLWKNRKMR